MVFSCPSCQQSIEADESYCGVTIECPACHQPFTVPKPQAVPQSAAPIEDTTTAAPKPQSRPPPPPPRRPPPPPRPEPASEISESLPATPTSEAAAATEPLGGALKVGGTLATVGLAGGLASMQLFRGVTYGSRCYYLAGAGAQEGAVSSAIAQNIQARAVGDLKVQVVQARGKIGGKPRNVVWARWGIGHGYVACFSPGTDLFVSARVNFVPGCLARAIHLFRPVEPNIFGVDDLNMLFLCVTMSVEETLDGLQMEYLSR